MITPNSNISISINYLVVKRFNCTNCNKFGEAFLLNRIRTDLVLSLLVLIVYFQQWAYTKVPLYTFTRVSFLQDEKSFPDRPFIPTVPVRLLQRTFSQMHNMYSNDNQVILRQRSSSLLHFQLATVLISYIMIVLFISIQTNKIITQFRIIFYNFLYLN